MKKFSFLLVVFAAVLLTGCFELDDTFAVNRDGSGSWKFKWKLGHKMTAMMESNDGFKMDGDLLMSEQKLRAALTKAKGAKLVSYSLKKEKGSLTARGEITFASIVDLYRVKELEEQLNWQFKKVDGRLEARITQGLMSADGENDITKEMDFSAVKGMMLGLKIDRKLILPSDVQSGNAMEKSGNQARWVFVLKSDTTRESFRKHSEIKPLATCSAEGVTFKLPLGPAGSVPVDLSAYSAPAGETAEQLKEVKITATRAQLMRNAKYTEDNIFFGNAPLTLHMDVEWPANLKPSGWSQLTINEAADTTGRKLTLHRPQKDDTIQEFRTKFKKENVSGIQIGLSEPARLAESYNVKGALLMHVPGSLKVIKVPGIKSLKGKKLEQPGLEEFDMTVKFVSGSNVQLTAKAPTDSIVDLKMISPDGDKEMKRFHLHRSKFRDEHQMNVGFSVGRHRIDDPTLVIVVAGEIGKYAVPFEFKDLKMP